MDLTLELLALRIPEIGAAAVRERLELGPIYTCPAGADRAATAMAAPPPADAGWRALAVGERWGVHPGDDPAREPPRLPWEIAAEGGSTHWLRVPFARPAAWRGRDVRLALRWEGHRLDQVESIVYLGGAALAGLDWGHRTARLPADAESGELLIRCSVAFPRPFGGAELQLCDGRVERLGGTMAALLGAAQTLPADAPARHDMLALLGRAYRALDLRQGYAAPAFAESAAAALDALEDSMVGMQAPADPRAPALVATGHGHLDLAWLWPIWRTRQKAAHTVATALDLMDRHPDYHFSLSQPQVYAWLKQDDPALYARLKERVAEGRLEPVGIMWVEPDCNLPSGESLVRQLVHGARFFAREFPERYGPPGAGGQVVWLPDAFGYTAALPQLMRGVGVSCFVTTKLSWNQVNRMPADTFRWRGIDGSEVLAHFVTATGAPVGHPGQLQRYSYGAQMRADEIAGTWRHYRQQDLNRELLYLFGHGDGGGGPTEEMLAAAATLAAVPGLPRLRHGRVADFFAGLYGRAWEAEGLPSWSGELYFEYHRGTYTSQAHVKLANRRAELRYREAEWLNAWASLGGGANRQAQLDAGWELILRNQFHDILPGSSIALVYADARADYAEAERIAGAVEAAALESLAPAGPGGPAVLNSLPWPRAEAVRLPLPAGPPPTGDDMQAVEETPGRPELLARAAAPAYGYAPLAAPAARAAALAAGRTWLESAELRLELDERGEIRSLYDKAHGRELAAPGAPLNQLVAYEDRPLDWDAWDIDHFYAQKPYPLHAIESWELAESGPLRATIAIRRRLGQSMVRQRISLWRDSRRVDFVTEVDWQERQTLLRALFPLGLNAERATCEIQFGALERPTHRNTSWEQARFEVCAHRWVDVAEEGYGVALLNDGKYGHSFQGAAVGISLLKGGIFPDPDADVGAHRFTYSLLPHAGSWQQAQVVRRAYELNAPLRALPGGAAGPRSFLSCDSEHVVVETLKAADDGDGLIVRLYEAHNRRGQVSLSFERPLLSAEETDLLERPLGALAPDGHSLRLQVRPFEVKTLRVRLG